MKSENPQAKVNVTVLYTEGCPHTGPAVEKIHLLVNDLNISVELNKLQITSQKEAEKHRFLGSPTIQINGLDIEPAARNAQFFGIT